MCRELKIGMCSNATLLLGWRCQTARPAGEPAIPKAVTCKSLCQSTSTLRQLPGTACIILSCNLIHLFTILIVFKWLQGAPCYDTEPQELLADASACIQQALQQAAAAKQPLLLTSSQHTRYAQPAMLKRYAWSNSSMVIIREAITITRHAVFSAAVSPRIGGSCCVHARRRRTSL
jgi:hypothetical protein